MGFSRQEYWSGLPLPSPPDCLLKVKTQAYKPSVIHVGKTLGASASQVAQQPEGHATSHLHRERSGNSAEAEDGFF